MPKKVYLIGEYHFDTRKIDRYLMALRKYRPDTLSSEASQSLTERLRNGYGDLAAHIEQEGLASNKPVRQENLLRLKDMMLGFDIAFEIYRREKLGTPPKIIYGPDIPDDFNIFEQCIENFHEACKGNLEEVLGELSHPNNISWIAMNQISAYANSNDIRFISMKRLAPDRDILNSQLLDIVINGTVEDHHRLNICNDIVYSLVKKAHNKKDGLPAGILDEIRIIDDGVIDNIMREEGAVVHIGGAMHFFGPYDNLYDRLKSKDVNVERHLLYEYTWKDHISNFVYRCLLGTLATRSCSMASKYIKQKLKATRSQASKKDPMRIDEIIS